MDRPDWLMSGICRVEEGLSSDQQAALLTNAYLFLSAGGQVTVGDWMALSEPSRKALSEAGDRIRAESAAMGVYFALRPQEAVELVAGEAVKDKDVLDGVFGDGKANPPSA
ncbi:MAG TPA: hypothetical protein DEH78_20240 [Solibacterales bacterium]|nr:hypothetical protein [Bryobacterales bacterium]